ncbi:NFACT family protein, partial [Helcococcus ovis]
MATDGITIRALTKEFNEKLTGGRVQKIYQINDHLILINIYNNKNNYKLLISSNPQNARIHLTNQEYKNPTKAPQFSMILRKHIQNSIIEKIEQIGLDRSVEFTFLSKDELGFNATKKLIIDIMGKHSNIVLTNEENKVIESIKRISHEMSSIRAVYPGTKFINLKDDKIDITTNDKNLSDINIPENFSIKKIFYMTYTGFGPQIAEEIAYK